MRSPKHVVATMLLTASLTVSGAFAHCDTMDGPTLQDAQQALAKKDVTPTLKWVGESDEPAVREAFKKALADPSKKQVFFETLIKLHREGEGAKYTGVKPAGSPLEPGVKEADQAIESGSAAAVLKLAEAGLKQRFNRVVEAKKHKDHSVEMGRQYVAAYVDFVHYAEALAKPVAEHGKGHGGHDH